MGKEVFQERFERRGYAASFPGSAVYLPPVDPLAISKRIESIMADRSQIHVLGAAHITYKHSLGTPEYLPALLVRICSHRRS